MAQASMQQTFPVFLRLGDVPERQIGTVTVTCGNVDGVSDGLAQLLRAAADQLQRPAADSTGGPDQPADGDSGGSGGGREQQGAPRDRQVRAPRRTR